MDEPLEALRAGLREALAGLGEGEFVIDGGPLIPTDRAKADVPYCSRRHSGMA
ncbi:hypothetical protein GO001_12820 [Streptomyces sp. NRRL B-1677]|uniref:hypothetical protein n=1 Tax=Streptomyces TaxID=1883 RepID=UPI001319BD76|nr:hypothetical protein [Streptomyces sp. NRRL B-1677]